MSEVITLTLPTEIAERAHKAANRTGKPVEDVLTEWIEQGSAGEDADPLQLDAHYEVWSPLNSIETAIALQKFIDEERQKQDT